MSVPSEDGYYWVRGRLGWHVADVRSGDARIHGCAFGDGFKPGPDDYWTWGPRIPTPDEQPKPVNIEIKADVRGAIDSAEHFSKALEALRERMVADGIAEPEVYAVETPKVFAQLGEAPCDECGGKGYVDLAYSRSKCKRGCGS